MSLAGRIRASLGRLERLRGFLPPECRRLARWWWLADQARFADEYRRMEAFEAQMRSRWTMPAGRGGEDGHGRR